jgi:maltooligosyltrehalose trehalohydrolase
MSERRVGPRPVTAFRVWAPTASRVELWLDGADHPMAPEAVTGWWSTCVPAAHGARYAFRVDGGDPLPDPRTRWQPDGVHAPSAVYDHSRFAWTDQRWPGRALAGAVVYELHVGTFTPEGTLDAARERLDHLTALGVSHVELLPLAAFDGPHGWGYDGVHLGAVHEPYGGPDALKRFVDAAHGAGLGVMLDVVYNHLGPSGNYLPRFGAYFTERHQTPWGAAVNLDAPGSDEVRRWIVANACSWLRDFHLDGLRLDAVHALEDDRAVHLLEELSAEVDALAAALNRPLTLVAESDLNDPRLVTPREAGGLGLHAQWSDDFHHALHALLTGERQGYYADFGSLATLAQTLTRVFLHDGRWSSFRGRSHGRPVDPARTPGWRFLGYLQDHDQVGNRATGDRIAATVSPGLAAIGAAMVLTAPFTPMIFMGEEWAARTPWRYFSSFPDRDLGRAVTEGRRREFADHGWDPGEVPDPQDPATFEASRLDWSEPRREPHASALSWYRRLLALRGQRAELSDPRLDLVRCQIDEDARTIVLHRGGLRIAANLALEPRTVVLEREVGAVLASSGGDPVLEGQAVRLPAESVAILELA